jgi:hypothetical protein
LLATHQQRLPALLESALIALESRSAGGDDVELERAVQDVVEAAYAHGYLHRAADASAHDADGVALDRA